MLIGATVAGREKVEVNPTTKRSHAIQGDKGILLTETNYACPESWSRECATRSAQVETRLNALKGVAPPNMQSMFHRRSESCNRTVGNTNTDLKIPLRKTPKGQRSFSYRRVDIWNRLSHEINCSVAVYFQNKAYNVFEKPKQPIISIYFRHTQEFRHILLFLFTIS